MVLSARLWPEVSRAFDEALALKRAQRSAWISNLEATRPDVALHVQQMLAAHDRSADCDPMAAGARTLVVDALSVWLHCDAKPFSAGAMVGPYKLVARLGQGGMADVWLAEQTTNVVRRVALKLPFSDLETPAATATRFAHERDLLAGLEHAHIARLYDAGFSDGGQPYLAMEWIDGISITSYADDHHLDVRRRIELFLQVLQAVRHAHARLVIHRDIKPSNILVTAGGDVKLLDFGIARLIDVGLGAQAPSPHTVGPALTPETASPEQLAGEPLSTPSDIYSLGVVLYELLTGLRPYRFNLDSATQSAPLLHATLLNTTVLRPSAHELNADVAKRRGTVPSHLRRELAGDLDAIVGKAMNKRVEQRYESAEALAADLERHLRFEPVQARGRSWIYVTTRMVRRHRVVAAVIGVAIMAIATSLGSALWQAQQAREEARHAKAIQEFLISIFRASAPEQARGRDISAKELLVRGTANLEQSLRNQPMALAQLDVALGEIFNEMGDNASALKHLNRAAAGYSALGLERSAGAIDALFDRGGVLLDSKNFDAARTDLNRCLQLGAEQFGPRHRWAVAGREKLAFIHLQLGETDKAMQMAQLALAQPIGNDKVYDTYSRLRVRNVVGQIQTDLGRYAEARDTFKHLIDDSAAVPSFGFDDLMGARFMLARAAHYEGDDAEALSVAQALVPDVERVLGPSHPHTMVARGLLSQALAGVGRYDEAIAVAQLSLKRVKADDRERRAIEQFILATHLKRAHRFVEALPLAQASMQFYDVKYPVPNSESLSARRLMAEVLLGAGRLRDGTALIESVRELGLNVEGYQSLRDWPATLSTLATARRLANDNSSALALLERACELFSKEPEPQSLATLRCLVERDWLRAKLAPQDANLQAAFDAAAHNYAQRFNEGHPARADLAMMALDLSERTGVDTIRRRSAEMQWQLAMHQVWPGRLIELH